MANTTTIRRGDYVQLRALPGLVARVLTVLYACEPPMVQLDFNVYMGMPPCVELAQVERVTFDTETQDWRAVGCTHDWHQVEIDCQECWHCGASRMAFSDSYNPF